MMLTQHAASQCHAAHATCSVTVIPAPRRRPSWRVVHELALRKALKQTTQAARADARADAHMPRPETPPDRHLISYRMFMRIGSTSFLRHSTARATESNQPRSPFHPPWKSSLGISAPGEIFWHAMKSSLELRGPAKYSARGCVS
eukprot:3935000-Rhodomonas_salina.1